MTVDHKDVDGASTHPSAEYWIIDPIARQLRVVKARSCRVDPDT